MRSSLPGLSSRTGGWRSVERTRGGLATAPVPPPLPSPELLPPLPTRSPVPDAGRGSRLLYRRVRRNSLSSEAPGVRVAAPVGRSCRAAARAGAFPVGRAAIARVLRSRPLVFVPSVPPPSGGKIGKRPRTGSPVTARRAMSAAAGCNRAVCWPKSRAGCVVTARRKAGLLRSNLASSPRRRGVSNCRCCR